MFVWWQSAYVANDDWPKKNAVYAFAALGQRGASVGPCTGEIVAEKLVTVGWSVVLAARAMTAAVKAHENVITHADLRDRLSDALDDAGALVAEHDRLRDRIGLIAHRDIGVTDSRCDQTHEYFVVAGPSIVKVSIDMGAWLARVTAA